MNKNQRRFTYRRYDRVGKPIACLPIEGKFLEQYGFTVGTVVDIQYYDGFVHIKKIIQDRYNNIISPK